MQLTVQAELESSSKKQKIYDCANLICSDYFLLHLKKSGSALQDQLLNKTFYGPKCLKISMP